MLAALSVIAILYFCLKLLAGVFGFAWTTASELSYARKPYNGYVPQPKNKAQQPEWTTPRFR